MIHGQAGGEMTGIWSKILGVSYGRRFENRGIERKSLNFNVTLWMGF